MPELRSLNLYSNKITDIKIFDLVKNFQKLKLFYIGENKFEINNINEIKFYEFPESLEEFGFTGNLDGKNENFIEKLGIKNLKIFYISRNKLKDLKCLKNIEFQRLEEFWAISNEITDIKEIMNINKKDSLIKINLKQNKINNFDELLNIIEFFPKLQKIGLVDNNIKEKDAEDIQKKIKEKYGNREIKIMVKEGKDEKF